MYVAKGYSGFNLLLLKDTHHHLIMLIPETEWLSYNWNLFIFSYKALRLNPNISADLLLFPSHFSSVF